MGYDIFVSYSSEDKLFVDALVNALENSKLRCWYAPRDIPAGVNWPSAIASAIRQIPVMLLVFSTSANNSQEVSRELTLASNNNCVVLPVRIENVLPNNEMEYHLTNRHWLDVYDLEFENAIGKVLEVVNSYAHLLHRGGDENGEGLQPGGADNTRQPGGRPDAQARVRISYRRIMLKKMLPLIAVFVLAAGGLLWYFGSGPGSLKPMRDAKVYSYGVAGGVTVKTLRLNSDDREEFLVQVKGVPAGMNGAIYRAYRDKSHDPEYWFMIDFNKRPFNIFRVNMGSGVAFDPETGRSYPADYASSSVNWADVQDFFDEYQEQQGRRGVK